MATLREAARSRITEILDGTRYTHESFLVTHDGEGDCLAAITLSSSPEYRFTISATDDGVFTTSECPSIHQDSEETFRRDDLESCINAIKEWVERISDKENDWIMDEFGGVADSTPPYR